VHRRRPPARRSGTPARGRRGWRRSGRPRCARRGPPRDRLSVRCARPDILPRRVAHMPAAQPVVPPPRVVNVEDHTVVILESMKMEMPVEAEYPGTVKEIKCEEGQSVQEGDVLVVLE